MARELMGDVIVLLPGILGSVLQKDGRDVWGLSVGAFSNALWHLGANVKDLAVPPDGFDDVDFDDGVTAPRLMPDLHLVPWLWKIDGYGLIAKKLNEEFELEVGRNYFEFPYDWRLDNRIAAQKLKVKSQQWLKDWRERSGNQNAKLILVGHSMGGLVSRYFLECLEGWRETRMLITFGTPYRGSLNALNFISNGLVKKIGFVELLNLSEMLRSFTSVYQLLPIYKCFDSGDGQLTRLSETDGIPNTDAARVKKALAFHNEIRTAVDDNLKDENYRNNRYQIYPIVGLNQPTFQSARLTGGKVETLREYEKKDDGGDGTVPRVSATPIELGNQNREVFANAQHGSLQNTDSVLTQLKGLLSGLQIDSDRFKNIASSRTGLEIEDAYQIGEPIIISARSESRADLVAIISETETNAETGRGELSKNLSDWQDREFPPLPQGTYRVSIKDKKTMSELVTDIFLVLPN